VGDFGFADIDPNVRSGMEVGSFTCEKSIRQQWYLNSNGFLQLLRDAIDTEAKDGYLAPLCIGAGDEDRPFLHIVICDAYTKYDEVAPPLRFESTEAGQLVDKASGLCLQLAADVREPGALLNVGPCLYEKNPERGFDDNVPVDYQTFHLNHATGEIVSRVQDMCVTAGWPLLTGAAFKDPEGSTVVVLMNEAAKDTAVVISDKVRGDIHFGINGRSIQTIVY
jgi:hypothetical protein